MDAIVVKLQRDMSGQSILVTDEDGVLAEFRGMDAAMIADCYDLLPLSKVCVQAEIDGNGVLILGRET